MFKRTKVCTGVLLALGGAVLATSAPVYAQDAQRVEITGSRIKRAAAEGSLPVTVIQREELEASGAVTIAEFIRNSTFASFGNFRPQSGSSAQGFSEVNLRGLGSRRTLVLVDGRRVAKDPQVGDAVDVASIPMAAVERVEILTDGASAVYGSDAIGGVINFILRKDFEGGVINIGETSTSIDGGDRDEASAIFGLIGDKGRMIMGASSTSRDIVYQRDYPWGIARGNSSFSNNFFTTSGSFIEAVGGQATCDAIDGGTLFYFEGGRCRYDFTGTAADEAAVRTKSVFARGEVNINDDWTAYLNASVSRQKTFGRYAPVPGFVLIENGTDAWNLLSPAAQAANAGQDVLLGHRFAAGGNRDTSTDRNLYDVGVGVQGTVAGFDVDVGLRRTVSKYYEIGRGYVIETLARQAIESGDYNILDPFGADPLVLAGFTATVGREGTWDQKEWYANATTDVFKMGPGSATLYVGLEGRTEKYSDIYDSLSEGGVVLGSAGSSAGGSRDVYAVSAELLLPITRQLEATVAARYEDYSDYGSDFSPKVSLRFQPMANLTLRASFGRGFSAPTLPQLTQKPAFSADSIVDVNHCLADGNSPATCNGTPAPSFQINGLVISNPELTSEKSKQWSLGAAWDVTANLSLVADLWNIKIEDTIVNVLAQELVNRENGTSSLPIPPGLSVTRDATGFITQVVRGATNEGTYDVQGIDLSAIFQHRYAALGAFTHKVTYSRINHWKINGDDVVGDFGEPQERATISNTWAMGPFAATWNINAIGKNGQASIGFVGTYTTHDVQVSWATPIKGTKLTFGALNVTEKFPQLVSENTRPFNFDLYDGYGRQVYGRLEVTF
jgi:iron complex outermembrane recepter protein